MVEYDRRRPAGGPAEVPKVVMEYILENGLYGTGPAA
jgi:hypothetical protein